MVGRFESMTVYPKWTPVEYLLLVSASATAISAACLKSVELAALSVILVILMVVSVLGEKTGGE